MDHTTEKGRKLHILHLNSEKSWRGGEQQLAYLLEELSSAGTYHYVICRQGSALEKYCQKHRIPHSTLKFRSGINIFAAKSIKDICYKLDVDLIHIHSGKPHTLAVLSTLLGNKVPMVLSRRIAFPMSNNSFSRWKFNHPSIKKIICISSAVEQMVTSHINKENCAIAYSGIDVKRFSNSIDYLRKHYHIASHEVIIGNVAALSDSKDLLTFIETADIFRKYNIPSRFVIIGEGPERETLQDHILQKKLGKQVILTGFLKNVNEVLPEFDIFLTTAKTEGLGTSVLDAFACKVAVVATRAGGIPEMVIHEKTGLLAEIKDAKTLAEHIRRLTTDPAFKRKLVENAYQHLLENFTKERMASRTLEIYQEVLIEKESSLHKLPHFQTQR